MNWYWTSIDSINELAQAQFDALTDPSSDSSPFLKFAFLRAFEETHCVGHNSGWLVRHIVIRDEAQALVGFLPAYIKTHSYGEYVFDHSWANAYEQHGLAYYPKLIVAVPFTPVTGSRMLLAPEVNGEQMLKYIALISKELMASLKVSSLHFLFAPKLVSDQLAACGFHQRQSVQFNWHNQQYAHFDDFMAALTARRRRSIRKERSGIGKQGVQVKRIVGDNISHSDMTFFAKCYQQTYLKRSGHSGYLSPDFFHLLRQDMPQNLLLVLAEQVHGKTNGAQSQSEVGQFKIAEVNKPTAIAAALFLFDENGLYGRYWGALSDISGLHFEACYYQGIEFCIERNIQIFNPGTQGEHKILRGFAPTLCYSNHKMQEAAFDDAISDFLQRETPHIADYAEKSASLLPYRLGDQES